jgi:hypothetical protein
MPERKRAIRFFSMENEAGGLQFIRVPDEDAFAIIATDFSSGSPVSTQTVLSRQDMEKIRDVLIEELGED